MTRGRHGSRASNSGAPSASAAAARGSRARGARLGGPRRARMIEAAIAVPITRHSRPANLAKDGVSPSDLRWRQPHLARSPRSTALASIRAPYSLPRNDHGVDTRSEALSKPVSATTTTHHSAIALNRGSTHVLWDVTAMTRTVARPPTHSDTATMWMPMLTDAAIWEYPACETGAPPC